MPKLRELTKDPPLARGDAENQLEEMRDYLIKVVEELKYQLENLDTDNLGDSVFRKIEGMIPSVPSAYTSNPEMDGTASPGSSEAWARGDHVHPSDTGKQDALTFDSSPTQNSTNPVTSGGIYSAMNTRYSETTLFSTLTDVHTDTTITLSNGHGNYKLLMLMFNSQSPASAGSRMPLTITNQELRQGGYYPLRNSDVDGYVRVNFISGQNTQIRIQDTNIATLYLASVTGLR